MVKRASVRQEASHIYILYIYNECTNVCIHIEEEKESMGKYGSWMEVQFEPLSIVCVGGVTLRNLRDKRFRALTVSPYV